MIHRLPVRFTILYSVCTIFDVILNRKFTILNHIVNTNFIYRITGIRLHIPFVSIRNNSADLIQSLDFARDDNSSL